MKTQILFLFAFLIPFLAKSQEKPLLKIGDQEVSVSEFKYIFEKNNQSESNKVKALREYLDLYTNFKLKVQDAKDMQLDTIPALNDELNLYRRQLSKNYLMDKEVKHRVYEEIYERTKEDVKISHILIKGKTDKELLSAKQKLIQIKDSINHAEDFEAMAIKYSEDPGVKTNKGNLGYLCSPFPSGFERMEDLVYSMEKGVVGGPVKSHSGYHLVFLHDTRPSYGITDVAHILVRTPKDATPEQNDKARKKINLAYDELQEGKTFKEVCMKFSEDDATKSKSGYIGQVKVGLFNAQIEDAINRLKEDGAYTQPILSRLGWHIFQRVQKFEPRNESLEDVMSFLEKDIQKSGRLEAAQKKLIETIKKEANYKKYEENYKNFKNNNLKNLNNYKWQPQENVDKKKLVSFGHIEKTTDDFSNFLKRNSRERLRRDRKMKNDKIMDEMFDLFLDETAIEYEEQNLESKYDDFRNLLREYEEGILLFEVTKRKIWDRAPKDTAGLKDYFASHRQKYLTPRKAAIQEVSILTKNDKIQSKILKKLKKKDVEKLISKYNTKDNELIKVSRDTLKAEEGLPMNIAKSGKGLFGKKMIDDGVTIKKVDKIIPSKPKTFKEAKGFVISDYQNYLEEKWIQELKEKYSVDINENILDKLLQTYQ